MERDTCLNQVRLKGLAENTASHHVNTLMETFRDFEDPHVLQVLNLRFSVHKMGLCCPPEEELAITIPKASWALEVAGGSLLAQ